MLRNRTYRGLTVHKSEAFPGKHEAIVDEDLWNEAQSINREPARTRARATQAREVALLRGLIFGPDGAAMTPHHAQKNGRHYRYYVSMATIKRGDNTSPIRRVPAGAIDEAVISQMRRFINAPEIVARTARAAGQEANVVARALSDFDRIWDQLFPVEQARLARLLVDRVDLSEEGVRVRMKVDGLRTIVGELEGSVREPRSS